MTPMKKNLLSRILGLAAAMALAGVRLVNESTRDVYEAAVRRVFSEGL